MTGQQRFIRTELKNFVKHAEIIHKRGNPAYYKKAYRLESLDKCIRYAGYIDGLDHLHACRVILRLRPDLERILPVPSNHSYSHSLERLNDLLSYCVTQNNKILISTV